MQTLQELGAAVAERRRALGLQQGEVAARTGLSQASLSRFERGRSGEFGARKLLAVLAVLDAELDLIAAGQSGTLDELRRERAQANATGAVLAAAPRTGPR